MKRQTFGSLSVFSHSFSKLGYFLGVSSNADFVLLTLCSEILLKTILQYIFFFLPQMKSCIRISSPSMQQIFTTS